MTQQEHKWLEKLSKGLENDARTFEKRRYSGFWNSVIDKYSDKAHFIYELLQNADDAGATEAEFDLTDATRLMFAHNGMKHFTISDPDCEELDQHRGTLGCLNAITSIGQSEKILNEKAGNQIGKFGIGFKSVFRYTDNPRIYDDNVCFELKHRIVPYEIIDFQERRAGWTIILLPYDRKDQDIQKSIKEITQSLFDARFPTLFLNNILSISCKLPATNGLTVLRYVKTVECRIKQDISEHECLETYIVRLSRLITNGEAELMRIRLFERINVDGRRYCVGYRIDQEDRPIPLLGENAFCFFQTDVPTGLKFLIHAPFRLTDNRQGILGDEYNQVLLKKLSVLAADAILAFRDIGLRSGKRLIDDSFIDVVPTENVFPLFSEFLASFERMISTEVILPTESGYAKRADALWPSCRDVQLLFPADKLKELLGRNFEWVFCLSPSESNNGRAQILKKFLLHGFAGASILNSITAEFVENQKFEWLGKLYKFLMRNYQLQQPASISPLLLTSEGKAEPAFKKNGESNIFLPIETDCEFQTVKKELIEVDGVQEFCSWLKLRTPSKRDAVMHIVKTLLPHAATEEEYDRLFKQVLEYYCMAEWPDRQCVLQALKSSQCIKARQSGSSVYSLVKPDDEVLYFPREKLLRYCNGLDAKFVDVDRYEGLVSAEKKPSAAELLSKIGLLDHLKYWIEKGIPYINFCCGNLKRIGTMSNADSRELSYVMWFLICECLAMQRGGFASSLTCKYPASGASNTLLQLREKKWLVNQRGELVSPSEMWIEDIPDAYSPDSSESQQMIQMLQMKRNPQNVALENLTEDNRRALDLGKALLNAGITTIEAVKEIVHAQELVSNPSVISDTAPIMTLSDDQYGGLSNELKSDALLEAKLMVKEKLEAENFVFEQGLCEKEFSLVNGVTKEGVEYPLVVHSYLDQKRQFQLSPADWEQLTKPRSMLWVRTQQGVGCVPFRELVLNREKIDLSFSTTNLELQDRIGALASVMRWFKGLHFDFGSLIQPKIGRAILFDLPEHSVSDEQKAAELLPDPAEGVLG